MNQKYYIRVGEIPQDEKSRIYNGDGIIGIEDGVSVYNAVKINDNWHIVMPSPFKEGQGSTYECLIQEVTQCRYKINEPRSVYLVTGCEVGIGHDGEPVIKNINIIKNITEQFFNKNMMTKNNKSQEQKCEVYGCGLQEYVGKYLVRNSNDMFWFAVLGDEHKKYKQCIPYDGNEHLQGTNKNFINN